jgi:hypothetical protein
MSAASCPRIWHRGGASFRLGEPPGSGRRIPQTLWTLAVRLVKTHGVSRTATALGLDYYRLKKQAEKTGDQPQSSGPAFVELPSPVVVGKQG